MDRVYPTIPCRLAAAVALFFTLGSWGTASAQQSTAGEAVRSVRPGRLIRLEVRQERFQGLLASVTPTDVAIIAETGATGFPLDAVDKLWVRGRSTGRGMLWGGVAGAVVGFVYGLLIEDVVCGETSCSTGEIAAITGLVAGGGGAVLGGAIGYFVPRWSLRFP